MELVPTKDLGDRRLVYQRARALGIKPYIKANKVNNNRYTPEDAKRISNYKVIKHHSIVQYKNLKYILENLDRNICDVASELDVSENLIKDLLDEYNKSGCLIVKSKL